MNGDAADLARDEHVVNFQLLREYWPLAYRFAVMITRDEHEAKDIAQEALIKAWRKANTYDASRGTFDSWLWRIVINVARDAGRAAQRRRALWDRLREQHHSPAIDVEQLALNHMDDQALLEAIRRLDKRPRTVIALRFGAGLGYREIGEQMGVSEPAALMATRRALDALRKDLQSKETSE